MSGKSNSKVLTELLSIQGVKVLSKQQHEGIGIILQIEPIKKESICPKCGTLSHGLHQNHRHLMKDLPLSGQPVYLEINRRRFKCEKCKKPFSEELDFFQEKKDVDKKTS